MENYMEYIEINPKVMMGKPVIKGTRITVEMILEEMSFGKSVKDLKNSYERLSETTISAALAFAADALKGERVYLPQLASAA